MIELHDADRVLDGLTLYAGKLRIEFKGLRRGSGKIIIRSVQNPSVEKSYSSCSLLIQKEPYGSFLFASSNVITSIPAFFSTVIASSGVRGYSLS